MGTGPAPQPAGQWSPQPRASTQAARHEEKGSRTASFSGAPHSTPQDDAVCHGAVGSKAPRKWARAEALNPLHHTHTLQILGAVNLTHINEHTLAEHSHPPLLGPLNKCPPCQALSQPGHRHPHRPSSSFQPSHFQKTGFLRSRRQGRVSNSMPGAPEARRSGRPPAGPGHQKATRRSH